MEASDLASDESLVESAALSRAFQSGATPQVSIGLPVFNGERTVSAAIESILAQSFSDFELIISDNSSTDGTAALCTAYASRDTRIRYIRQEANLGALANYEALRPLARGRYFMWAAADDVRSPDFLAENVAVLDADPNCVAATSPNVFEGQEASGPHLIRFALVGTVEERFDAFFANCWRSHGIFYSLMRTDVMRRGPTLRHFMAVDWAFDLFLASQGTIRRAEGGLAVFGMHGMSRQADVYRMFRNSWIERGLPFYELSRYALSLTAGWDLRARLRLMVELLKLNLFPTMTPVLAFVDTATRGHLKALYKRWRQT